jgi:hypothetical protein
MAARSGSGLHGAASHTRWGGGDDVHVIDLLGWLNQTKDEEEFMAFSDDEEAGDEGGS